MMMMSLLEMCKWMQETQLSVAIRESIVVFPILEGAHLLAIGLSAGIIAISDLRMMGLIMKKQSASEVFHQLLPWSIVGFAAMLITGFLLFWSEPVKCYLSNSFRYKTLFLFLAGINVLVFHSSAVYKRMADWEWSENPPRSAKLAGLISLISWGIVIIAGRTTAYNF